MLSPNREHGQVILLKTWTGRMKNESSLDPRMCCLLMKLRTRKASLIFFRYSLYIRHSFVKAVKSRHTHHLISWDPGTQTARNSNLISRSLSPAILQEIIAIIPENVNERRYITTYIMCRFWFLLDVTNFLIWSVVYSHHSHPAIVGPFKMAPAKNVRRLCLYQQTCRKGWKRGAEVSRGMREEKKSIIRNRTKKRKEHSPDEAGKASTV